MCRRAPEGYDPTSASVRQPGPEDPSSPSQVMPDPTSQPSQPLSAPSDAQHAVPRGPLEKRKVSAKVAKRKNARKPRARPARGKNAKRAMQPEQNTIDSNSSDVSTPTKGSSVCCQEDSNLVARSPSPATVQGDDLAQPFPADSIVYPNPNYSPAQPNGTHYPPYIPACNPDQPFWNNNHGQEGHHGSIPGQHPPPSAMTQYAGDPTHLTLINQTTLPRSSDVMNYDHLNSQQAFSAHDSAGSRPPTYPAFPDLPNLPGCLCGMDCNCPFCTTHLLNQATQNRVKEMTRVMASDNYLEGDHHLSQPESGTGGTLTNGINTESAVGQDYPPLAWNNGLNQGESANNNDLSNHFSPPTMQDSEFLTLEYPLISNYSDTPGGCLGTSDCICVNCLTSSEYDGLPK